MATIAAVTTFGDPRLFKWETLTSTNADGAPVRFQGNQDRTVQVIGADFGGGTLTIQGSLDGTNWDTLQDLEGAALSFTQATGPKGILESTPYTRPFLSGATGGDVDVILAVGVG